MESVSPRTQQGEAGHPERAAFSALSKAANELIIGQERLMERLQDLLSRLSFGLVNASQRTQLNKAVRAPPTCKNPVGLGAKRVRVLISSPFLVPGLAQKNTAL